MQRETYENRQRITESLLSLGAPLVALGILLGTLWTVQPAAASELPLPAVYSGGDVQPLAVGSHGFKRFHGFRGHRLHAPRFHRRHGFFRGHGFYGHRAGNGVVIFKSGPAVKFKGPFVVRKGFKLHRF